MPRRGDYELLFGDIHNHNALGYGVGSLERSIDIGRTHLDFFAFTGHSSWHDLAPMEGGRERVWLEGFERLKEGWGHVQDLIADANRDGAFNAFLGFEWHSSAFGDQCVIFPGDHRPLAFPDHIGELRAFCRAEHALMIPHHLAYPTGQRGVNWAVFDETCTPVVEIYSEHGNSADDRGPFPYFSHSMGGRVSANTAHGGLAKGLRFGFVASSDNHAGFPGAYGEGVMAVLSRGRERASILDAINSRRTCALTGDRIAVDFRVNGASMGETIAAGREIEVSYDVDGRDELEAVEVIQDGHVAHRDHPRTRVDLARATAAPFQLRLEWGWGPWGALALERIADWAFEIAITDGRLLDFHPCLQSGPFDEERRHRIRRASENVLEVVSYTSRKGAYRQNPNQSMVLEIAGTPETRLSLRLTKPAEVSATATVAELHEGSARVATGPFPGESCLWHRLVPRPASRVAGSCVLEVPDGPGYCYLRVRQRNGHMAWASPVFVNYD